MNRQEYLLACLSEECAEVQHAVGKSLRFGVSDVNPKTGVCNEGQLMRELSDVFAVVDMLIEEGVLPEMDVHADLGGKQAKVEKWMKYSQERGTLV